MTFIIINFDKSIIFFGGEKHFFHDDIKIIPRLWGSHRFERISRYHLGLASIGNSLETVGSYANNS
jgi:hypothetical protein